MQPGQLEPNEFELAILERIASEHAELRPHLGVLRVLSREFTGVGSYTNFRCEGSGTECSDPLGLNGLIMMPGVPNGMGAVLFCHAGRPKCLETFTYGADHWSGVHEGFSIDAAV